MTRKIRSAEELKALNKYKNDRRHLYVFSFVNRTKNKDYAVRLDDIANEFNDDLERAAVEGLIERHGCRFSREDIKAAVSELRQENARGFYRRQSIEFIVKTGLQKISCAPGSLRKLREMITTRQELEAFKDRRELQREKGARGRSSKKYE